MTTPLSTPLPQNLPGQLEAAPYTPRFQRSRWNHPGTEIDKFFDHFVPRQYEYGFAWRCAVIGKGEQARAVPFEGQPSKVQSLIAGNAEVLLELFEETRPDDLDLMREVGKQLLALGVIDPTQPLTQDLPSLREDMSRRHHEKWHENFKKDLAAGLRSDPDHRGAKPYDELPLIERAILKVQTWGNWRVLANMNDEEYALVRSGASKKHSTQQK